MSVETESQGDEATVSPSFYRGLNGVLVAVLIIVVGLNLWQFLVTGGESAAEGKPAPSFSVPTVEGDEFALKETEGQVVILDFWATWCPPCEPQLDYLKTLTEQGPTPDGLRVVSVNTNEQSQKRKAQVENYVEAKQSPFTTVMDDGSVSAAYGVTSLPTIVVIDDNGEVTHAQSGLHSTEKLRALAWEAAGGTTPEL